MVVLKTIKQKTQRPDWNMPIMKICSRNKQECLSRVSCFLLSGGYWGLLQDWNDTNDGFSEYSGEKSSGMRLCYNQIEQKLKFNFLPNWEHRWISSSAFTQNKHSWDGGKAGPTGESRLKVKRGSSSERKFSIYQNVPNFAKL